LPFTGAAIGGLAIVGGAAVAIGRALASASRHSDARPGQSGQTGGSDALDSE
jgi:hypothetical protein